MLFDKLIATLKADPRTIVFTEGPDPRILGGRFPSEEGRTAHLHPRR